MMDLLLATSGGESQSASGGYVDDVFSAYTYTGNGSTQTINNGIDLAGKGGLVWIKNRSNADNHSISDSARGVSAGELATNLTNGNIPWYNLSSLNNNGFSLTNASTTNTSGHIYASWTFRKAPKFFDIVTYSVRLLAPLPVHYPTS